MSEWGVELLVQFGAGCLIRIDSTTLEAHITYPTDVGLVHQAIKILTHTAAYLGKCITATGAHQMPAEKLGWVVVPMARRDSSAGPRRPYYLRIAEKVSDQCAK